MAASSSSIDPSNELAKQSEYAMQSFEHIETTLLPEEQVELDLYKKKMRFENELYLREHPEIRIVLKQFVKAVMKKRPANIGRFAAVFFSNPSLSDLVTEEIEKTKAFHQQTELYRPDMSGEARIKQQALDDQEKDMADG